MNPFARHPGLRGLSRFADGEVGEREVREMQAHLAECERCRGDLAFVLEVRRVARQISHPSPPRDTLEEILRRRRAGDRVILPTATPPARRLSPRVAGPFVLLFFLLAAAGVLLLSTGEASAGASALSVGPERPHLGQPLEMEFRAASSLAAEERLVLRGRYRTAEDGPTPGGELGSPFEETLARSGDGVFAATTWLPPAAVYAVFAVEDPAGTRVETAAGRPWEVLAHDEAGRPLFAALAQRFRAMEAMRRPDEMRATAVRMTELYPDEPEGWFLRLVVEERSAADVQATGLTARHRQQFARLELAVSHLEDPGAERIAALANYAERLGETESAERWRRRLLTEHPTHAAAQRHRVLSIVAGSRAPSGDPGEHLRALELEWDRAGAVDPFFLQVAFKAALASADPERVPMWADRLARFLPSEAPAVGVEMTAVPGFRVEGMERVRRSLARLESGSGWERPLLLSRVEHARRLAAERRGLLAALGRALVADGRLGAGLDTLALAATAGWDPRLFRELGAGWAAAGRPAEALGLYGMAAADPLAGPGLLEEARAALGGTVDREAWSAALEAGRAELRRRMEASPAGWPPGDGEARVRDAEGREVELVGRLRGRTSLLAFWAPGAEEQEALGRLAGRLAARGAGALAIWDEPPPGGLAEPWPDLPAFHDDAREASEELGAWPRPWHVVLDEAGRVRYEGESLQDAFRHAYALAAGSPEAP